MTESFGFIQLPGFGTARLDKIVAWWWPERLPDDDDSFSYVLIEGLQPVVVQLPYAELDALIQAAGRGSQTDLSINPAKESSR